MNDSVSPEAPRGWLPSSAFSRAATFFASSPDADADRKYVSMPWLSRRCCAVGMELA